MADDTPSAGDTAAAPQELLFSESGASWYWMLAGPGAAAAMIAIQITSGAGVQWIVPFAFFVLVSGFIGVQIKAARIHTSVELTRDSLRQGAQTIGVDEIVKVYPAAKNGSRSYYSTRHLNNASALSNRAMKKAGVDPADLPEPVKKEPDEEAAVVEKWQSARALGELTGVPRGRTGIGVKLTGGRTVQAWARRHQDLRVALTELVEQRRDPSGSRP
jgi:hypothetical protein